MYDNQLAQHIIDPRQAQQRAQQQAVVDALRSPQFTQANTPVGQVQAANTPATMQSNDQMMSNLGGLAGSAMKQFNVPTALKYGTNPGSQQTSMLAAQDAAFL